MEYVRLAQGQARASLFYHSACFVDGQVDFPFKLGDLSCEKVSNLDTYLCMVT
jgi:hypothetical protein